MQLVSSYYCFGLERGTVKMNILEENTHLVRATGRGGLQKLVISVKNRNLEIEGVDGSVLRYRGNVE
jgi:hypothetical protein